MVGNDVVDLRDPELLRHPGSPRFDARVLTPGERDRLASAADPVRLRWRLWAAKEAAFKLASRAEPGLVFAPSRFVVSEAGDAVAVPGRAPVRLRVDEGERHVHAIAWEGGPPPLCDVAFLESDAPDAQSRAVRALALDALARAGLPGCEIRREGRAPVLYHEGRRSARCLSLSHHGRVVGFAASPGAAPRGARSRSAA